MFEPAEVLRFKQQVGHKKTLKELDPPVWQNPTFAKLFDEPSREHQRQAFCGANKELEAYCRNLEYKRSKDKPGGVTTAKVADWYKAHQEHIPQLFRNMGLKFGSGLLDLQVCHILCDSWSGANWIDNYVIHVRCVNQAFDEWWTPGWARIVGEAAIKVAKARQARMRQVAESREDYRVYQPVASYGVER